MTEMVTRHAATCIGLWEKGRPPTEPSLTEECIVAELKTYALRDTADGRATVKEASGKELAEARREIKRDKKVLYGLVEFPRRRRARSPEDGAVLKSEVVNLHRTGDEAKIPKTLDKAIEWVWAWMPPTGIGFPRGTSIKAPRHQAVFKTQCSGEGGASDSTESASATSASGAITFSAGASRATIPSETRKKGSSENQ
jgi:hypothetical protein